MSDTPPKAFLNVEITNCPCGGDPFAYLFTEGGFLCEDCLDEEPPELEEGECEICGSKIEEDKDAVCCRPCWETKKCSVCGTSDSKVNIVGRGGIKRKLFLCAKCPVPAPEVFKTQATGSGAGSGSGKEEKKEEGSTGSKVL